MATKSVCKRVLTPPNEIDCTRARRRVSADRVRTENQNLEDKGAFVRTVHADSGS